MKNDFAAWSYLIQPWLTNSAAFCSVYYQSIRCWLNRICASYSANDNDDEDDNNKNKIRKNLTGKARDQVTTEKIHIGRRTHTSESTNVKVQNIKHGK